MEEVKLQNLTPVADYARKMGISVHLVYLWAKRGKIKMVKIGNYRLVKEE